MRWLMMIFGVVLLSLSVPLKVLRSEELQASYLAYTDGHDIFITIPGGRGSIRLTDGAVSQFRPTVAPDGQWIAYLEQQKGERQVSIFVMRADGSGKRQLGTAMPRYLVSFGMEWSPNSGHLFTYNISTHRAIETIYDITGSVQHDMHGIRLFYSWVEDGSRFVNFGGIPGHPGQRSLFVLDTMTGANTVLDNSPDLDRYPDYVLSPNHQWIYYRWTYPLGWMPYPNSTFYRVLLDGTLPPQQVATLPFDIDLIHATDRWLYRMVKYSVVLVRICLEDGGWDPVTRIDSFSQFGSGTYHILPETDSIAYLELQANEQSCTLVYQHLDGVFAHQLFSAPCDYLYPPMLEEGNDVAWFRVDGMNGIVRAQLDGTGWKHITADLVDVSVVGVSPNGHWLLTEMWNEGQRADIGMMPAEGGAVEFLATNVPGGWYSLENWSPVMTWPGWSGWEAFALAIGLIVVGARFRIQ